MFKNGHHWAPAQSVAKEPRRETLVGAAHDGHLGNDVESGHVAWPVGPAEHAAVDVHVLVEVTEPEAEVVLADPPLPAHLVVLIGDGQGVRGHGEHAVELDHDGVGGVRARDHRSGSRAPCGGAQRGPIAGATSSPRWARRRGRAGGGPPRPTSRPCGRRCKGGGVREGDA